MKPETNDLFNKVVHGVALLEGSETVSADMVELIHHVSMIESDYRDCINELCLKCGKYHDEYTGACNGCRWLNPRRGW